MTWRRANLMCFGVVCRSNGWPLHEKIDISVTDIALATWIDQSEDARLLAMQLGAASAVASASRSVATTQLVFSAGDAGLTALWNRELTRERTYYASNMVAASPHPAGLRTPPSSNNAK